MDGSRRLQQKKSRLIRKTEAGAKQMQFVLMLSCAIVWSVITEFTEKNLHVTEQNSFHTESQKMFLHL